MQKYDTPHVEINLQDLQVCKSCTLQIQVIEGRDNGRRRPKMGPRSHTPPPTPQGGSINFPALIIIMQCPIFTNGTHWEKVHSKIPTNPLPTYWVYNLNKTHHNAERYCRCQPVYCCLWFLEVFSITFIETLLNCEEMYWQTVIHLDRPWNRSLMHFRWHVVLLILLAAMFRENLCNSHVAGHVTTTQLLSPHTASREICISFSDHVVAWT